MPKLPFKRKAADDANSLSAYIPAHMVDYTALPPIEEDTALTRFKRLPLVVRIGAVLLPILLLVGTGWSIWQFYGTPETEAVAVPKPTVTINSATVVSAEAIVVEARVENAANGTPVSGALLQGDQPLSWADAAKSTDAVRNGTVTLRIVKAAESAAKLNETGSYSVQLTVGQAADAISAQSALEVPTKLRSAFFGTVVVEATPEPTPTTAPTATPTAAPTPEPSGPPTLEVTLASTLLISPTLGTGTVAQVAVGTSFEPLLRTADNSWFLVQQNDAVGWLNAEQIKIDPAASAAIPLVTPDAATIAAAPLKATVFNGGNIRYRADVKTGTVLGQLHARQEVALVARTADSQWFHVIAPEAEGFVSVSLLTIDPAVLNQVPIAKRDTLERPVGAAPPPAPPATASGDATTSEDAASSGTEGTATNVLAAALLKSQSIHSYRLDFEMKGKLPLAALPTSTNAQSKTVLQVIGDVSGKNIHLTIKGPVTALVGADAAKGVQLMMVDGTVYIHGPLSIGGMSEPTWYKLGDDALKGLARMSTDKATDLELLQRVLGSFTRTASETLDGQQCEVYHIGKDGLIAAFEDQDQAAEQAGQPFDNPLDNVDLERLDVDLWACADGYIHQGQLNVDGRGKAQAGEKVALEIRTHVYDLNQTITIVAPRDAVELKDLDLSGILAAPGK